MASLLSIQNLSVVIPAGAHELPALRGVSFDIEKGEILGLVGESGSGKSMAALAVLRLLPPRARVTAGRIELEGANLLDKSDAEMRHIRGGRIAMVFQEPMTCLNPVFTVGFQLVEAVRAHQPMSRTEAWAKAERLLDLVAIPAPRKRLRSYAHELSGGQRQRVMIAMALAAAPDLLIADEPTTGLDVTIEAQILQLLAKLREDMGLAVLLITHDLAVVAENCQRVVIMYAGQVVEEARVASLFRTPAHPYTRSLLRVVPRLGKLPAGARLQTIPGQVPDLLRLPRGCTFHPRCEEMFDDCRTSEPAIVRLSESQYSRCLLHHGSAGPEERTS